MEFEDRLKSSGAVYQEVQLARSFDSMRGEPEDHNRVRRKDEWPHSEEKTKRTSEAPASGRDRVPDHNNKRNSAQEIVTGKIWLHWFEGQTTVKVAWQTAIDNSCPEDFFGGSRVLLTTGQSRGVVSKRLGRGGINGGAKGGSEEQGRMDSSEVDQEEEEMVKEELILKPRRRLSQFQESDQSRILNLRQRTGQMAELAALLTEWKMFLDLPIRVWVWLMMFLFWGMELMARTPFEDGTEEQRIQDKEDRGLQEEEKDAGQRSKTEKQRIEDIGVKESPIKARSFISLNNKSIIKE
ncbi:hypothetical protein BY996DRAFT_6623721 [Phakopsora pachyrhizi]|nr:hypothetical protein BY996DRAFT_6623721 [Phakopsora pachyrhizi]